MAKYCPIKRNYALYLDCNECREKLCNSFFCLVVGSRSFTDYEYLSKKLDYLLQNQNNAVIVSGGAKGADSLAERYAQEKGLPLMVFPADWEKYGKKAGYLRNKEMMEFVSKFKSGCAAFWDGKSRGTQHSINLAKEYGVSLKVVICG